MAGLMDGLLAGLLVSAMAVKKVVLWAGLLAGE